MVEPVEKLRANISAYLLEPLFWGGKRLPVLRRYRSFRDFQRSSVASFEQRQKTLLANLISHATVNIPFYRDHATENHLEANDIRLDPWQALRSLPVTSKSAFVSNRELYALEIGRGTFRNSTGGSTGQPVEVLQDRVFQCDALATTYLFYEWALRPMGYKTLKLWGAERDLLKGKLGLNQRISDLIGNRKTLNAFRMDSERMLKYVQAINSFRPACIEAYASSIYELARYIGDNGLVVFSPGTIVSAAGTLFPHMRREIESVFGCEVFDRYGSREAGNMAAECREHKGLHVFGETTIIEVVDENGNAVSEGEEGEILVTNLSNYTMPLIRYRIGDRARAGTKLCECGLPYPKLERIAGRIGETFRTRMDGVVSPEFFIHLFGVMCNDGSIDKFQVIQKNIDHVVVRLKFKDDGSSWASTLEDKATALIKAVLGKECLVDYVNEIEIEPTPTGKHLYTICELKS